MTVMTVITGWRNRKPAPDRAFSADRAFNGVDLKNAQHSTAANERLERLGLDSINTEPLDARDKHKKLVRASI